MSHNDQSFGSEASFVKWVTDHARDGNRLVIGYELRTWRLRAAIVDEHAICPPWSQREVALPVKKKELQAIWREFNEANFILFFLCEGAVETILVAARNGLWRSLDERYMPSP